MARSDQNTQQHDDLTSWVDQFGHVHDSEELWGLVFEQNVIIHETQERVEALENALRLVHQVLAQQLSSTS